MELIDFLRETRSAVRSQINDGGLFEELIYASIVTDHMAEIGMTYEPVECHYEGKIGNATLRLSGYALSDDINQLDLFVSLYRGVDTLTNISDSETRTAAEQCLRFLSMCSQGKMAEKLDPSSDARSLAETLHAVYNDLEHIRLYVITDCVAKSKSFKTRELSGKAIRLEVMDIERLYRHLSEGKPRDELIADFVELSGQPIPCVFVEGQDGDYAYALTAVPGEALRYLYEKFGGRLLEANVRSFLSTKGKGVNAGIQNTLRSTPDLFIAYNNGIVVVADDIRLGVLPNGGTGIAWLKGMQIVNGGQTTASLFFTKRKFPDVNLANVRVAAKIVVMRIQDPVREESLISDISRFANTQNSVRQSDLSANKPYHIELEKVSRAVYCPDGVSQWFYERAAGSYNTLLAREGNSPAKLKRLKEAIPPGRKITKTDLARYLNAWDQKPESVSLGAQKNFEVFMSQLSSATGDQPAPPSPSEFKLIIAKAKLYREAQRVIRSQFQAFQANITAYTVALISRLIGDKLNLERIWQTQAISPQLLQQIEAWAREVNEVLHETAAGRMISEWAKKSECREAVFGASYTPPAKGIPELSK